MLDLCACTILLWHPCCVCNPVVAYLFMLNTRRLNQNKINQSTKQVSQYLMFQLPLVGSCCILKLSKDIPKVPKIEFPRSFSLPSASSFSLFMRSSYRRCKRFLRIKEQRDASKFHSQLDQRLHKNLHCLSYFWVARL